MSMSIEEVARFILSLLQRHGELLQEYAGIEVESRFGSQFARLNEIGQTAIDTEVLAAFRTLCGDAVWCGQAIFVFGAFGINVMSRTINSFRDGSGGFSFVVVKARVSFQYLGDVPDSVRLQH